MKIEVTQYSIYEAVAVDSDYQRAEDEFYAQWREDIDAEEQLKEVAV